MIRLTIPSIEEDDLQAVREVLESGFLVQGKQVAAFEEEVAAYVGTRYAVAVSNCTAALLLALQALEIGPGDKVAVTTYSWPATANVIVLCGAEPVFVDIDPATYNMDPEVLAETLRRTRVRAILPVHTFGGMADMERILQVAETHGAPVIEDAACALGADLHGKRAGAWGVMGCFSFHPRKAITTGEGGMITTNDARLSRRLRILRNHGLDPDAPAPEFVAPGYNMRLTEFQGALGRTQLTKLDRLIAGRIRAALLYDSLLNGSEFRAPKATGGSRHVYQSYVVSLKGAASAARDSIVQEMRERGVEVTIGTYHMPLTSYFRQRGYYRADQFKHTDEVAISAISLPLYEQIDAESQAKVVATLIDAGRAANGRRA